MEDKSFLLIIAVPGVLIFLGLLNFIGDGQAFGLNPMAKSCIGLKISRETTEKYFSYGESELKAPLYLRYWVQKKTDAKIYCLGQNM